MTGDLSLKLRAADFQIARNLDKSMPLWTKMRISTNERSITCIRSPQRFQHSALASNVCRSVVSGRTAADPISLMTAASVALLLIIEIEMRKDSLALMTDPSPFLEKTSAHYMGSLLCSVSRPSRTRLGYVMPGGAAVVGTPGGPCFPVSLVPSLGHGFRPQR